MILDLKDIISVSYFSILGASNCFKSPRILQPRFTAQIRPSPTAVIAPIRRQQCVPRDISLTNEIDVKMETSSPRKQGSFCSKKGFHS